MTLDELQTKFKDVLLCAPLLAADLADMVQDERADERERCALLAERVSYQDNAEWIGDEIRNRRVMESN